MNSVQKKTQAVFFVNTNNKHKGIKQRCARTQVHLFLNTMAFDYLGATPYLPTGVPIRRVEKDLTSRKRIVY